VVVVAVENWRKKEQPSLHTAAGLASAIGEGGLYVRVHLID